MKYVLVPDTTNAVYVAQDDGSGNVSLVAATLAAGSPTEGAQGPQGPSGISAPVQVSSVPTTPSYGLFYLLSVSGSADVLYLCAKDATGANRLYPVTLGSPL